MKTDKLDQLRMRLSREELAGRIMRALPADGVAEPLEGLTLARSARVTERMHSVFRPAFCVIAQGGKEVFLGDEMFRYDSGHYLISTVDLPIVSHVVEASEDRPYLSVRLDLDTAVVTDVMIEAGLENRRAAAPVKAMDVSPVDADLLDAIVRLVRLLDRPDESPLLAPLVVKEIVYRLWKGEQGARLGHLQPAGGDARRISKAIDHLREHFQQPLRIENIARELGMSVSGFHHHFKSVTAMSPLQFQKQIRLQEARRLMLGEALDAASAGHRVGYEDPAYFSRDYKKLFGAPPQRDIARLRNTSI
ncbi:MAG: AraC family transcriptional regulator [Acidobacteria bacterium]|nr:AraC family transcriptional regulator [Acidobacteriota bacterium]